MMAFHVRTQATIWTVAAVVTGIVLWRLGTTLLPFVLGAAVAYFLDPVADRLERLGLSRVLSVVLITLGAVVLFALAMLLVIPTLVDQGVSLVNALPGYVEKLHDFLATRFPDQLQEGSTLQTSLQSFGEMLKSKGGELVNTALTSAMSVVSVLTLVIIVPVVAFYMLIDWDRMVAAVDELLPRDHAPTIRHLAGEIDRTMSGFLRGQGTVCLILGAFYAVGLMLAGLNFGMIIGVVAGFISFIPYIGTLVGGALAIGVAVVQFWGDPTMIAIVAAIFIGGHLVEGNYLSPKLVGGSVGLHPVWLLLAMSVFATLFGFIGLLVAVPVSAMIGVLVRFAVEEYMDGRLYRGVTERRPGEEVPRDAVLAADTVPDVLADVIATDVDADGSGDRAATAVGAILPQAGPEGR